MNLHPRTEVRNAIPERARERWENLADASPKDRPWDTHRREADGVCAHLLSSDEAWIEKLGARVERCAPWLKFATGVKADTGELALTLKSAWFCKVKKSCPVCMWRRALMFKARFYDALPSLVEQQPKGRWLFLTLTVRNCEIEDLREQIQAMSKGWQRLSQRKEFRDVAGWIRGLEITRGANGSAHPHYHILLLAKTTYFKGGHYIATPRWVQAWREAMRLDYDPICHIKAVRADRAKIEELGADAALRGAVAETLKYSVKPSDMLADRDWFLELVRQTYRTKAIASGGLLRGCLREHDETQQDLLLGDEEKPAEEEAPTLHFNYDAMSQHYRRKRA
jgi:plasmid rolling circle replication initiator protein Rep